MAILDSLVSEVLVDVNVLGTLPSSAVVVAPLQVDARFAVVIGRRVHSLCETHGGDKVAEIDCAKPMEVTR